jgi:hypothetical protein
MRAWAWAWAWGCASEAGAEIGGSWAAAAQTKGSVQNGEGMLPARLLIVVVGEEEPYALVGERPGVERVLGAKEPR